MPTYHVQFANSNSTEVAADLVRVEDGWTHFTTKYATAVLSCAPGSITYYKLVRG